MFAVNLRTHRKVLACDGVVGLVVGTRPDCISDELLDYLERLNRQTFLTVEYGIESTCDATLERINRGHTFECSRRAIAATHDRGIITGGHIIVGLPLLAPLVLGTAYDATYHGATSHTYYGAYIMSTGTIADAPNSTTQNTSERGAGIGTLSGVGATTAYKHQGRHG